MGWPNGLTLCLEELESVAPAEINAELSTAREAFQILSDVAASTEPNDIDENDPDLRQASTDLDRSGSAIEAYVTANCGLES